MACALWLSPVHGENKLTPNSNILVFPKLAVLPSNWQARELGDTDHPASRQEHHACPSGGAEGKGADQTGL